MSRLISMLISVIIGYIIVRIGLLRSKDSKPLSTLVAFVLQPALIIHAMQIELTPDRTIGFIFAVVSTSAIYLFWILLTRLLKRPLKLHPVDETTLCYSNVGNLMLPVISMVLGDEMVFYATALQIPFNLFIWTHGSATMSGRKTGTEGKGIISLSSVLLNSNIIALAIGLLLLVLHLQLPEILYNTAETLTGAVAPVSMLVIGMVIAEKDLRQIFLDPRAIGITFGRLVLLPMLTMFIFAMTGILQRMPAFIPVMQVVFLCLSAPPAATVSQLAVINDEEPVRASTYNTLGMVFCVLTIPLMNLVFQTLFMHG